MTLKPRQEYLSLNLPGSGLVNPVSGLNRNRTDNDAHMPMGLGVASQPNRRRLHGADDYRGVPGSRQASQAENAIGCNRINVTMVCQTPV